MIKYYINRISYKLKFLLAGRKSKSFVHGLQQVKNQPFYIVSAGRSGSTLLRRMLMAGGEVHIPPESDDFQMKLIINHLKFHNRSWLNQCTEMANIYEKSGLSQYWDIDKTEYYNFILGTPIHQQNLYFKIWSLHNLHALKNDAEFKSIGDKTPLLVEWMPWLHLVNSKMNFIFLIRDIRDVIASRMKYFDESVEQAFNRYYTALKASRKFASKHPERIIQVRYEDLIYKSKETLTEICNQIGIKYADQMLTHTSKALGDDHLPHHTEVHLPVSDRGVGRWKEQLDEKSLKKIHALVDSKRLDKKLVFFQQS